MDGQPEESALRNNATRLPLTSSIRCPRGPTKISNNQGFSQAAGSRLRGAPGEIVLRDRPAPPPEYVCGDRAIPSIQETLRRPAPRQRLPRPVAAAIPAPPKARACRGRPPAKWQSPRSKLPKLVRRPCVKKPSQARSPCLVHPPARRFAPAYSGASSSAPAPERRIRLPSAPSIASHRSAESASCVPRGTSSCVSRSSQSSSIDWKKQWALVMTHSKIGRPPSRRSRHASVPQLEMPSSTCSSLVVSLPECAQGNASESSQPEVQSAVASSQGEECTARPLQEVSDAPKLALISQANSNALPEQRASRPAANQSQPIQPDGKETWKSTDVRLLCPPAPSQTNDPQDRSSPKDGSPLAHDISPKGSPSRSSKAESQRHATQRRSSEKRNHRSSISVAQLQLQNYLRAQTQRRTCEDFQSPRPDLKSQNNLTARQAGALLFIAKPAAKDVDPSRHSLEVMPSQRWSLRRKTDVAFTLVQRKPGTSDCLSSFNLDYASDELTKPADPKTPTECAIFTKATSLPARDNGTTPSMGGRPSSPTERQPAPIILRLICPAEWPEMNLLSPSDGEMDGSGLQPTDDPLTWRLIANLVFPWTAKDLNVFPFHGGKIAIPLLDGVVPTAIDLVDSNETLLARQRIDSPSSRLSSYGFPCFWADLKVGGSSKDGLMDHGGASPQAEESTETEGKPDGQPEGPRLGAVSACEYLSYEELPAPPSGIRVGDIRSSVLKAFATSEEEWKSQFDGLLRLQCIAKHAPFLAFNLLPEISASIGLAIASLRSGLSKNAILTCSLLGRCLPGGVDEFGGVVIPQLLARAAASGQRFVSDLAFQALKDLCCGWNASSESMKVLCLAGREKKNPQLNLKKAELLLQCLHDLLGFKDAPPTLQVNVPDANQSIVDSPPTEQSNDCEFTAGNYGWRFPMKRSIDGSAGSSSNSPPAVAGIADSALSCLLEVLAALLDDRLPPTKRAAKELLLVLIQAFLQHSSSLPDGREPEAPERTEDPAAAFETQETAAVAGREKDDLLEIQLGILLSWITKFVEDMKLQMRLTREIRRLGPISQTLGAPSKVFQ